MFQSQEWKRMAFKSVEVLTKDNFTASKQVIFICFTKQTDCLGLTSEAYYESALFYYWVIQ